MSGTWLYFAICMLTRFTLFFISTIFFGILFFSCSTEEVDPQSVPGGNDFYPIEIGRYWIYKVDTTSYTFAGDTTQGTYFIKEKITDSLYRQEGHLVYRTEFYKTLDTSQNWTLDSVWSIRADPDKILKTENNRPLVKLKFPVREGSSWDINQFNPLQDSNAVNWVVVKNFGLNISWNGQIYPSLQVVQKADSNCVNNSLFFETYLKGIGLAFRRRKFITYDLSEDNACSEPIRKIEIGYDKFYTLLQTGKE